MMLDEVQEQKVIDSCIKYLGNYGPFEGTFTPTQQTHNHGVPPSPSQPVGLPEYEFNIKN